MPTSHIDTFAADQVQFSNIDVATSNINTLKLQVTTSGPSAGLTKIVNSLGQSVNLNYYEISSTTGAAKISTGFTQAVSGSPEAVHTTISESR